MATKAKRKHDLDKTKAKREPESKETVLSLKKIVGKGYKEFWETRKRYRVLVGSRSSKKSTTVSLNYIVNLMKYSGSNLLVVRKFFKDHKDSTYAQLCWAIRKLQVEHLWDTKLSPLEIIYKPTGQKILFRGLDDPQSITSITVEVGHLCWVWFEEFFQVNDENDFNMVDGSIRGAIEAPLFKQITGTMNPWNEKHWIKRRFFDEPSEDTFTLRTDYRCNEFLDSADHRFFEHLKKTNPRRYNVEGLGNWGVAEGLVFDNWSEENFDVVQLVTSRKHLETGFGLDFGYTADPSAFIGCLVDTKAHEIYIFEEHYERGMRNDQIASMINYKGRSKELIVADSAEPKSIDEIKRLGVPRIRAARKGQDSILHGIQFIQQFKIIVHPSCVNTILELNNYAFDSKNGKLLNKPIDSYNHLMDALRYALERFLIKSQIYALSRKKAA